MKDQLHNPGGTRLMAEISLPLPADSVDRILLWSVFTHMTQEDIAHFMKEFHRVLKPGGKVFATFFIINNDIVSSAQATNRTIFNLRFEHPYGDGCFINDVDHPMGAVAFTVEKLREMVSASALSFRYPILFGSWSGFFPTAQYEAGQDAVVLVKL